MRLAFQTGDKEVIPKMATHGHPPGSEVEKAGVVEYDAPA
jgi:hypothetical protein